MFHSLLFDASSSSASFDRKMHATDNKRLDSYLLLPDYVLELELD